MNDLAKQLARLSPEKRRLLEQMLGQKADGVEPIPRRAAGAPAALLSPSQQRLWFLEQLQPGTAAYHIAAALELHGNLDAEALRQSLVAIVARHDSLRTSFAVHSGEPTQCVHADAAIGLPLTDLSGVPEAKRRAEMHRRAVEEARRPFHLARGPLVRARLFRLNERDHVAVLTLHHAIADGWSMRVLVRELAALYKGFVSGEPVVLPGLPIQYADFTDWQRDWLQGPARDGQLDWWKKQLAGVPTAIDLLTDRPRPGAPSYQGARIEFHVTADVTDQLRALSRTEGVTLYVLLLAAYQTLLWRYTGQDDLIVGSPVANRSRRETEPLIGFFVNTLPLRGRPKPEQSFRDFLRQTRQAVTGALAHQELPFEQIVDESLPQRDLSRHPLAQVLFAFDRYAATLLDLPGLELDCWEVDTGTAKFDLMMSLSERPDHLAGFIEFSSDLFQPTTADRFGRHFLNLLRKIVADPGKQLADLSLADDDERRLVVRTFNATDHEFPDQACLHTLIEEQVQRTPGAVAVWSVDGSLTYTQLDRKAGQLAAVLRRHGVGPDVLVGVCLERSPDLVVALYGVLKAGGAYVPFDPDYPRDRLAFMAQDAAAPVLLTQAALADRLPATSATVLRLDADWEAITAEAGANSPAEPQAVMADHLAYVIYTSGSTGRPKGAQNVHRGIVNRLLWMQHEYRLTSADRVLQKTPFSFDVSVWEFFWPLLTGARIVMARPGGHRDSDYLVKLVRDQGVTVLHFVPSMLQLFLEEPGLEQLTSLRHVICSGEALSWEAQEKFFARVPAKLHNLYGPTEASVDVTFWECQPGDPSRVVPIGRPIWNTRMHVLDQHGQLCPVGVPGELCIGGVGLGRGYHKRPELTREKFLASPLLEDAPGARLYRTGDRGRWRADGSLDYLGRFDFQVKLRGQRIELGEVESALLRQPGVMAAVVVLREDRPGDQRLVGYVAPDNVDTGAIRAELRTALPEYMVPSAVVALPKLPLSPNGKLDRKALPPPPQSEGAGSQYDAPRSPTEALLAGLVAQVLGLNRVGVRDNFFERGGDSLKAARLAVRLREAFGADLPLRYVFERPTVAGLAERLAEARTADAPPLLPAPAGALPVASFAQQRLWLLEQLQPGSARYNMAAALRLDGPLSVEALKTALAEIVRRHQALRTGFQPRAGQPEPFLVEVTDLPLTTTDLSGRPNAEREFDQLAAKEAAGSFDLAAPPLLRGRLVKLAPERHRLVLVIHHIAADGWSLGVFVRELGALYKAYALLPSPPLRGSGARGEGEGPTDDPGINPGAIFGSSHSLHQPAECSPGLYPGVSVLPEPRIQYADFAAWQRAWLTGPALDRQLAWWRDRLAGAPQALDLPTDKPRPATPTGHGDLLPIQLTADLTARLGDLAHQENATPYMVLLAAFQTLLSRYSGQDDVAVGSPVAGRSLRETERLIGFFVNTLVQRGDLSGNPTFRELLQRTRDGVLESLAYQDLPFEHLVEALVPQRDLSRAPLFQVMFAMQNTPLPPLELPRLRVEAAEIHTGTAKFDLTLSLAETEGRLTGSLEYSTDLFEPSTAERLLRHFAYLLEGIAADADRPLCDLPLMDEAEQRQVLFDFNPPATDYPRHASVHALFEEQAKRAPNEVALELGESRWTYAELNDRADRLSGLLQRLGVRPGELVGLFAGRSPELVAAHLAVLKAGAAYQPLDVNYPRQRLEWMLRDGRTRVLLTEKARRDVLPTEGVTLVELDDPYTWTGPPTESVPVDAEAPAYVMYTSGSTGEPKGIVVPHRAIVRLVRNTNFMTVEPDDVFLQLAPVAFDAATLEVWGPLLNGARLAIAPPSELSLTELGEVLRHHGVTRLWLTAGLFHVMVDERLDDLKGLRQLLAGGDVLSPAHCRKVVNALGDGRLWNGYGPTENTTFSACCRITRELLDRSSVPIGRPIAHSQIYVLDAQGRSCPVGVPGELFVGGDGLANGYWQRPALTAEKFVFNPLPNTPGTRLYRTGDRARWLVDGQLEFLGRLDGQVKLRGFRIELGEIEAALANLPSVASAAVTVHGKSMDKILVGYVVPRNGSLDLAALREALTQRLPEYMVPAVLLPLSELPLSPNGKVDRRRLPAPPAIGETAEGIGVEPRTDTERRLTELVAQVLGREFVSVQDNFFHLGGHSLKAAQLAVRIREAFDVELPLRAVFEGPTVEGLARIIGQAAQGDVAPPLRPRPADELPVVSFAQQRLWFLEQWDPGSPRYTVAAALNLEGPLHADALTASLTEVVRRQQALRTGFEIRNGQPGPVLRDATVVRLEPLDLRPVPDAEAEAERLTAAEVARPFDLAAGDVFRARLLRLADSRHRLVITAHHIAFDGWSLGVFVRELSELYAAAVAGRRANLPELPVQYADFAAWQRAWLQGPVLERQVGYWREKLAGAAPALELPIDKPRPATTNHCGGLLRVEMPAELTSRLHDLSRHEGATLYMTLLAGLQALLSRYSGQEDVLVGSPVANRNRREVEPLVGFFVNTLVMRGDLTGGPTFRTLLRRTRDTALAAYAHQDLPFEQLVEALQPQRDASRTPFFQVMFALQNAPLPPLELAGLHVEAEEVPTGAAKFELNLSLFEMADGRLAGSLEFSADLFEEATAARLMRHLTNLLVAAATDPDTRLSDLPLMDDAERHRVVVDFNATQRDYPRNRCLHELVEEQAQRAPHAVAVTFGGKDFTYAELDRHAERLAVSLRRLGIGPDGLVGVCLERSANLVAALLGVLKAGGAYVPLDPDFPRDRLAIMAGDAGLRVFVTQQHLRHLLPADAAHVIDIDHPETWPIGEPGPEAKRPTPDHLAYVLFTSGSTGRPKGVQVRHRGVVNVLWSMRDKPGFTDRDVLLAVTTLSFDIAMLEVFLPLIAGGRLVLLPRHEAMDGRKLVERLRDTGATALQATPATWQMLLTAGWSGTPGLKALCGGEALPMELARQVLARCDSLWNLYGPTETTIWSTVHQVRADEAHVPIGQPVANTRIYVLDANYRPCPIGVSGELCIGGDGVSRGYLHRPDLTAQRYIPSPISEDPPGACLYRTGDQARWCEDGSLEYLGRIDFQVKLRGYRIELGEIEASLLRQEGVIGAAVALREDRPGDKRLVGYVTPESADGSALRERLRASLPEYMVPSLVVPLTKLPLTPSGKVDRKALPEPMVPAGEDGADTPLSQTEELVAGVVAEVLGLPKVGAKANFFDLGGHSLLATQVVSRLREAFQVELPLRSLFEAPTVSGLARLIETTQRDETVGVPLVSVERTGELPLAMNQETLWFLDQLAPGSAAFNMPLGVRLRGPLDVDALQKAVVTILRRHEALRTSFGNVAGRPVAIIAAEPPELPLEDLTHLPAEERERRLTARAEDEARRPFDLAHGPLVRGELLKLNDDDHALLLTVHHSVFDGWSSGVFVRELAELYNAFVFHPSPPLRRRGVGGEGASAAPGPAPAPLPRSGGEGRRGSPLPDPALQYVDFAHWQRRWLETEAAQHQLDYWKKQLGGPLPVLDLPTDHPRGAERSFRGGRVMFELTPEQTAAVAQAARREGATLYMILLAAFQALLSRYSGQEDILVGSPVANRTRRETEALLGFFVNTLVLRGDLSGDPTFRELLHKTREVSLSAYAHQDLPFEKVMEAIRPERHLSHSAVFQVMFVLQNAPLTVPPMHGLTAEVLPLPDNETAKFDLTLALTEHGGRLIGSLEFNRDLFEPTTAQRMVVHLQSLLADAAAHPQRRLSELVILTESERGQVLEFAQGPKVVIDPRPVIELVEEQIHRTPVAVALEQDGVVWTYAELGRRASALAGVLRAAGVGPGALVGVCLERSPDLIAGLLAVLKAGGAYVPLDPTYPLPRLAAMADDAGLKIFLTRHELKKLLPIEGRQLVLVEEVGDEEGPETAAADDLPAYVIYTSGSAGRPKGVLLPHSALTNFVQQARLVYGIGPTDRVLQFASVSFDASIEEIFPVLSAGGTLVLRTDAMLDSLEQFLVLARQWRVSVVSLPTAFWHELVADNLELPEPLRLMILGGERAMPRKVAQWRKRVGERVRLLNTYGPTEGAVVDTWSDLTALPIQKVIDGHEVPIGRPLGNVSAYVLDRHLRPCPVGVPGELCIGGAQLALGYLNRAELTAEKFVHDQRGERLYRTGDRVRWRLDGQLEFLGRVDMQVKVRGFRVEPGEIEAALARHSAVRAAAVVPRREVPGVVRLVAYAEADPSSISPTELRKFLAESLPDYMVPSAVVVLEKLPLTVNGKIDCQRLPSPDHDRPEVAKEFVAPRSPIEELVAKVWAEALGLERVGVTDHFFELGGHSLQAMQLVAKIGAATGQAVSVRTIFLHPTVEAFAAALDALKMVRTVAPAPSSDAALAVSPHLRIERRPLTQLFLVGKLPPVDAAALSYFPTSLLHQSGLGEAEILEGFCQGLPIVSNIHQTPVGRIASVLLPRFEHQLYQDRDALLGSITDALHLVGHLGARAVSLTGLLPSATDYGHAIAAATVGQAVPPITTGHATTAAGLLLALGRLLEEAGRDFAQERVSLLGLGSVGRSFLRLVMARLPHPREICLCELEVNRPILVALEKELREEWGYTGPIKLLTTGPGKLPDELYDCTCAIAATNATDIIEVERLRPGTLLFDDSAPACFNAEQAVRRLRERGDLLFTVSDQLRAPRPLNQVVYVPAVLSDLFGAKIAEMLAGHDPHHITGCVLASALTASDVRLAPSVGLPNLGDSLKAQDALTALGFRAAELHVEGTIHDAADVARFRDRFGGRE